jgi:predicted RNA-binding protein with PUA-like domain
MAKSHWLVKSEADTYAWSNLEHDKNTRWDGVRNFAARNHLREMKLGDEVLFYHSGDQKQIVGIAKVVKEAYPDPTGKDGDWSAVDLAPVRPLGNPVTLATLKADPALSKMTFVRQGRLSVSPVTPEEFARIVELARAAREP